jgi:hypothetical protein
MYGTLAREVAMSETIDKLTFVSLDGRDVRYSRADIIHAPWGWQVELYQVPPDSRPLRRQVGVITVETPDGYRYFGAVIVDLVTEGKGFVLLSGIGHLRMAAAEAA